MKFINEADRLIPTLPVGSAIRLILEFLHANARGAANAQPWERIEAHLSANGIQMTKNAFQQTILKDTRENNIFIASNDHGRARGYYLIDNNADALTMRAWYNQRIQKQLANLANLDRLIALPWP